MTLHSIQLNQALRSIVIALWRAHLIIVLSTLVLAFIERTAGLVSEVLSRVLKEITIIVECVVVVWGYRIVV